MTLFNAIEGMLTERTGRLILAAVNYARDANDRMRVVVDGGSIVVNDGPFIQSSSTAGTYRPWNDPRATFSMDQREMQRLDSLQAGMQSRQKWSYS